MEEKYTLLWKIFMSTVVLACLDSGIVISKYLMNTGGEASPSARILVSTYLASCLVYLAVTLAIFGACLLVFRKSRLLLGSALFLMLAATAIAVILFQSRKILGSTLGSGTPMILLAVAAPALLVFVLRQRRTRLATESVFALHMAFAAVLFVWPSPAHEAPDGNPSPNVVFILIDAMRYDRLGCYGSEEGLTPSIDRIAPEACVYENAYVHWPTSGPSHSSMFTGRPVYDHRAMNGHELGTGYTTLAEVLKANGYLTAAFVQNKLLSIGNHYDQGFDLFVVDEIEELKNATPKVLFDRLLPVHALYRLAGRDRFTKEAIRWMEQNRDEKIFLFMQYFHPHIPYTPPGRFIPNKDYDGIITGSLEQSRAIRSGKLNVSREDIDYMVELYNAEVSFADEQVGLLYDFLEEHGMLENTMFIITSDHGENLYEHEKFFAHGNELYESTVHIPLVIRYPEGRGISGRSARLMRDIDLMPHILSTCGIDTSGLGLADDFYVTDGIDMLGISCNREQTLLYTKRENWKYILELKSMDEQLYDLALDPHELHNLAAREPELCASFRESFLAEVGENTMIANFIAESCGVEERDEETRALLKSLGYID